MSSVGDQMVERMLSQPASPPPGRQFRRTVHLGFGVMLASPSEVVADLGLQMPDDVMCLCFQDTDGTRHVYPLSATERAQIAKMLTGGIEIANEVPT